MFDTYHTTRTEQLTKNIIEHRAPTDESVRLLRDMEGQAKAEILKAVRLDRNELKAVFHKKIDALTMDEIIVCMIDLNGKRVQGEISLKGAMFGDELAKFCKIKEELASIIAKQILSDLDGREFTGLLQ